MYYFIGYNSNVGDLKETYESLQELRQDLKDIFNRKGYITSVYELRNSRGKDIKRYVFYRSYYASA